MLSDPMVRLMFIGLACADKSGIKDIFANSLVIGCALTACMGGLLFGFDQGLVSIVLVMPRFLSDFPIIDQTVTSGASLYKG